MNQSSVKKTINLNASTHKNSKYSINDAPLKEQRILYKNDASRENKRHSN